MRLKENRGFSLAEIMIASSLIIFSVTVVASLGYMGQIFFKNAVSQTTVQSKGKFAMEQIMRELRGASDVTIVAGGESMDIDTTNPATSVTVTSRYYINSTGASIGGASEYELRYMPDINVNSYQVITQGFIKDSVTNPFTNVSGAIRVKFEIREEFTTGQTQNILLDSRVVPRNMA